MFYNFITGSGASEPNPWKLAFLSVRSVSSDEPPHRICSYTLLFSLFLHFLYITDPPLHTSALTWLHAIALTSSDRSHLFDGHMTYNSHVFTSILSISNMPPPAVWPIMSSCTARSGTFSNFALCSLSCFPFIFNLPVFTFRGKIITKAPTNCLYESPSELRFSTYTLHCLALILHYFASHRTATIPPSLLATIHLETIPYPQIAPPQSPIGFILRFPAS